MPIIFAKLALLLGLKAAFFSGNRLNMIEPTENSFLGASIKVATIAGTVGVITGSGVTVALTEILNPEAQSDAITGLIL
jgi:hypothetical protein